MFLDFWVHLDGITYVHKSNPCDQAEIRESLEWQRPCKGFNFNCTYKCKSSDTRGATGHFIVTIAHGKKVVLCGQCVERITGVYLSDLVGNKKLILQNGEPRSN